MITTPRRRALLLTALVPALVSTACGGDDPATQTGDDGVEVTELSIAMGPDPVFAPHIVAMEKGWFEEEGFASVDPKEFEAGALAGEALAAGEIQLWTPGNLPPISLRHNGLPIVVLGTSSVSYNEALIIRNDAGVETSEDLYDIRIGLLEGSTASAVVAALAEHYELDAERLQIVNLPPPEQVTAIQNDEVQAVVVWQPFAHRIAELGDMTVLNTGTTSGFADDEGESVPVSSTRSLWVTSEDFVRESPNAAAAMIRVLLRAQEYVADPANRDEVLQTYVNYTGQPLEEAEAIWDQLQEFDPTMGEAYVEDMKAYTTFLEDTGRISDASDPLSYTYTDILADLDESAVQVDGEWQP